MACRDGPDHGARPLSVLLQMIKRQRENLVWRQPRAVLVNNSETIRIAVQSEAELGLAAAHETAHLSHAFGIRFGMMAAEERIGFAVEDCDLRACTFKQRI